MKEQSERRKDSDKKDTKNWKQDEKSWSTGLKMLKNCESTVKLEISLCMNKNLAKGPLL